MEPVLIGELPRGADIGGRLNSIDLSLNIYKQDAKRWLDPFLDRSTAALLVFGHRNMQLSLRIVQ
jgi:hypothetical protein